METQILIEQPMHWIGECVCLADRIVRTTANATEKRISFYWFM